MRSFTLVEIGAVIELSKAKVLDNEDLANFPFLPQILDYFISVIANDFHQLQQSDMQ